MSWISRHPVVTVTRADNLPADQIDWRLWGRGWSLRIYSNFTMRRRTRFFLFILLAVAGYILVAVSFQMDSKYLAIFPLKKLKTAEIVPAFYVHCDVRFEGKKQCPELYTELEAGRCDLINGSLDCPDIRNRTNSTRRQAQLVMTRMLRIFDLLAQKHNIFYWIAHGTLLGAVRHQGFIPWDSDIDIHIPLEDYVKFFKDAAKELPADIFFQNTISDPELKPNDEVIASNKLQTHETVGIYQRTWNPRLRDRNSCYRYCLAHDCKWHDGLMVDIFVFPRVRRSFYPLKQMAFEGFLFPVPSNWKVELQSEYGQDCFEIPTERGLDDHTIDPIHGCEMLAS